MNIKFFSSRQELTLITVWAYIPAALILIAAVVMSELGGTPIAEFTRDPAAVTNSNPLNGFVSNVGVLFWCSAATMCFLTSSVLFSLSADRALSLMIFLGGLLTTVLLIDDFFMLHDRIIPDLLGIHEKPIFLLYMFLLAAWLLTFRKQIMQTSLLYLGIALAGFSMSVAIDHRIPETLWVRHHLYEDGFKFIGVASWSGYFLSVCLQSLRGYTIRPFKPSNTIKLCTAWTPTEAADPHTMRDPITNPSKNIKPPTNATPTRWEGPSASNN